MTNLFRNCKDSGQKKLKIVVLLQKNVAAWKTVGQNGKEKSDPRPIKGGAAEREERTLRVLRPKLFVKEKHRDDQHRQRGAKGQQQIAACEAGHKIADKAAGCNHNAVGELG